MTSGASTRPGLKTLEDALEMRRRVLLAFEQAEREQDRAAQRRLLTFVVVGGGPDGRGAGRRARRDLAPRARERLPRHRSGVGARHPDRRRAAVLPTYPEDLSAFARRALERLGVAVWTGSVVTDVAARQVHVGDEVIEAGTILWAAGVSASTLGQSLGAPLDRAGRVLVNDDLTVPGHPEVFVVGDLAALKGKDGNWLPGVAQVAMQQAAHAAANVRRAVAGQSYEPFAYHNFGNLATIGRNSAVADLPRLKMRGIPRGCSGCSCTSSS